MHQFSQAVIFFFLGVFSFVCLCHGLEGVDDAQISELPEIVEKGLKDGEDLLLKITTPTEMKNLVRDVGTKSFAFLSALGFLWNRYDVSQNAKEVSKMQSSLEIIHQNMNSIDLNFVKIKELIDWSVVRVSYGQYERSIMALRENMMQVLKAPAQTKDLQKNFFLKQFESDYQNAATKLYQSIAEDDFIFNTNLLQAVRKYTRNNRALSQQFGFGIYKLVVDAVELEIVYMTFSGNSDNQHFVRANWESKLMNMQNKLIKMETEIRENYMPQLKTDVNEFIQSKNLGSSGLLSVSDIDILRKEIMEKYDWFYWITWLHENEEKNSRFAYIFCPNNIFRFKINNQFTFIVGNVPMERENSIDSVHISKLIDELPPKVTDAQQLFNNLIGNLKDYVTNDAGLCERHSMLVVMRRTLGSVMIASTKLSNNYIHKYVTTSSFWGYYEFRVISFG